MMKVGDKRLALRLASSWSGYSTRRGLISMCNNPSQPLSAAAASPAAVTAASSHSKTNSSSFTDRRQRPQQLLWMSSSCPTATAAAFSSTLRLTTGISCKAAHHHSSLLTFSGTVRQMSISAAAMTAGPVTVPEANTAAEAPPVKQASEAAATPPPTTSTPTTSAPADAADTTATAFVLPDKPVPTTSGLSMEYTPGTDPPLEAVGLGSWAPPGRVQVALDYLHNTLDIPWCGSILIATLCMRLCIFPLVVWAQKNMALLHNNNHEISRLQNKMTEARQRGDVLETAKAGGKLQAFMKEKGINPLKNTVPIMAQIPFFISMFFGLRGLANLPMETMETGGIGWFKDLTIPDPYYGLSLVLATSTFVQLKIGADGMKMDSMGNNKTAPLLKVMMFGIPCILFPATMNFASAVTFYWCCNNLISLGQAQLIKNPRVRGVFGIPQMIKKPLAVAVGPDGKKQTFRQSLKDSIANFKAQAEIVDRRAHDERVFREIGASKAKRTFKFDPTKRSH